MAQGSEEKEEVDPRSNIKGTGINSAACGTRIISFSGKGGWCSGPLKQCNEWLEQCKNNVKIQNISTVIRHSSSKDSLYYWLYVTYTIDKQGGNGWNTDGYKSRIKLFYCTGSWGRTAEKACNGWLEKCNENLKVEKIWNLAVNSSNPDTLYYFYFVAYTIS